MKQIIKTEQAPAAIGPYSQAIKVGNTVYLAGQIPLNPQTMTLISEEFNNQAEQVFRNLEAVAKAAQGELTDVVRLTIYLTDLANFAALNEVMRSFFKPPYPARTAFQVVALPKGAKVEVDAILHLTEKK